MASLTWSLLDRHRNVVTPLTVIFDRSAFHGLRFDLLRDSPLLKAVKEQRVIIHHTMVLLEETISMFERESNKVELRKQLSLILDICNGRWFRERGEIWELELTQNLGLSADVFAEEDARRLVEEGIRAGVHGPDPWRAFTSALPAKDVERRKQARVHQIQNEMRRQMAAKRKVDRRLKNQKLPPATEFIANELEDWGEKIISRYVGTSYRALLVKRWQREKERFPFLTSSLRGQVYSDWYALVEHNKSIDRNAHVDVDVLSCLNRADAIVSADEGFQRDAFEVLWRPKEKRWFSPEGFVQHLASL